MGITAREFGFPCVGDENILELNSGDGWTALLNILKLLNCTLENSEFYGM